MKKLEKLTKEQEQKIAVHRNKWLDKVFKYQLFEKNTFESVKDSMIEMYDFCGLKKPIVLLVDSPYACQIAANMFNNKNQVWDQVGDQVRSQVWGQVGDQVRDEVRDQLGNQVWDQVGDEVRDQVGNQVWGQVGDQVGDQVRGQVRGQVRDQVRGQVWGQVRDQVWGQVWGQVRDQVRSQVGNQVWGQVGDQVRDQVRNQVWGQVGGQVRDQVGDEVRDQVRGQVRSQVRDQVGNQVWGQVVDQVGDQVRDQVRNQVWDQVGNQVGNQVWGQVRDQVRDQVGDEVWGQVRSQVRDQVGDEVWGQVRSQVWGQKIIYINFSNYCNSSDFGWESFYDFFFKESEIKIDRKEDLEMCIKFSESSFMSIQLDGLCIVSKYPNHIYRNKSNGLHNSSGFAISFADGYGQNYVNGRYLEPKIFNNSQTIQGARKEFLKSENEDIKACIITIIKENFGNSGLMDMLNSELVDEKNIFHTKDYSEKLRLYRTKEKYSFLQNSKGEANQPYAWIEMTCPSTGNTYLIDTCPLFTDVVECAKWHRPEVVPNNLDYAWISAN